MGDYRIGTFTAALSSSWRKMLYFPKLLMNLNKNQYHSKSCYVVKVHHKMSVLLVFQYFSSIVLGLNKSLHVKRLCNSENIEGGNFTVLV